MGDLVVLLFRAALATLFLAYCVIIGIWVGFVGFLLWVGTLLAGISLHFIWCLGVSIVLNVVAYIIWEWAESGRGYST